MLLFVKIGSLATGKVRTEISTGKSLHCVVGISAKEHGNSTHTKHLSIAIRVARLKLLKGGRDTGEAREEDIHDGDWGGWNWVAGYRRTFIE